ncbi:MAG: hypothetical protein NC312_07060 [Bacteroides fragilis]|nr:hypothetical protein [Bacteroides fragilis]
MYKKTSQNGVVDKEEQTMDAAVNMDRPCTISESIIQSCKEVKSMREGRIPKRSLNDLFANIEKWSKEEEK